MSYDEIKTFLGVKFITESCILLGLSHQVRYKALMMFHSFNTRIDFISLCTASLLLASKLEEEVCTLKRIIYVFNYLYTEYESKPRLLTNRLSIRMKEGCIMAETEMLKALGFDLVFEDVYGALVDLLAILGLSRALIRETFALLNAVMVWPRVLELDSKSVILMVLDLVLDKEGEFKEVLEKYKIFERKRFNLETYEEVRAEMKIDDSLLLGFAKRQKRG